MAAAAHKRVGQLGILIRSGGLSLDSSRSMSHTAQSNEKRAFVVDMKRAFVLDTKRAFLVDTLALARRLEAQGMPSKQAEVVSAALTEVLNNSLENVSQSFVSKELMQRREMMQDASLSNFKSEVKNSQEHQFSLLQRETEKLRSDLEKMHNELRYEIRFMIQDELSKQSAETSSFTNKFDQETHSLWAHLEASKYDVIKYCIGTLASLSAVGLAVICIML